MKLSAAFLSVIAILALSAPAAAQSISIVAAENFYGDVAQQIGGSTVKVTSILTNPDQDPHLFEASASTARALTEAQIVLYNGIDYDPWMARLLSVSDVPGRTTIVAAQIMQRKGGDNPHLWYDPATIPAMAQAIAAELEKRDPAHNANYVQNLQTFLNSMQLLQDKIAAMKNRYADMPVTATEPVFGYMAAALGLRMRNAKFQLAVQNDTEPSARDVASFQTDLGTHKVKALIYNSQTSEGLTKRMQALAQQAHVPVVGVSETEPAKTRYQDWMMGQLDQLDHALSGGS